MLIYVPGVWAIDCCQVLSSTDLDIIKIVTNICDRVVEPSDKKTKWEICYHDIFKTCGINITHLIHTNKAGIISYNKQIINDIRSLNGSLCLKYNYGVSLTSLGVTHRLKDNDYKISKDLLVSITFKDLKLTECI